MLLLATCMIGGFVFAALISDIDADDDDDITDGASALTGILGGFRTTWIFSPCDDLDLGLELVELARTPTVDPRSS